MIISFDQNAASYLESSSPNVPPVWSKIKSLLLTGVSCGKIVCPIPWETAWESIPLSDNRHRRIKELQTILSRGFSFKSYVRLLGEELLALVRTNVDLSPFEAGNWHNLGDQFRRSTTQDEFLNLKKAEQEKINADPIDRENQVPITELETLVRKGASFDLYNNLERLRKGEALAAADIHTAGVCRFLQDSNISSAEIDQLKELVLQHKYESIPIHFYYNRFFTQLEFALVNGGRKLKTNDFYDLTRVATALWASQIYVCDAEMANACNKAKISALQTVPTIVVSTRQPDFFLQNIESILK